MIKERKDYRFVTQNAMKRVTIDGSPYPVRDQKLILLGEDEAFFAEALRERRYATGIPGNTDYTKAILRIDHDETRKRESVKSLIGTRMFFDADKMDKAMPLDKPFAVAKVTGRPEKGDLDEAMARVAEMNAKLQEKIDKRRKEDADEEEKRQKALDKTLKAAEDEFKAAVAEADANYAEALERQGGDYDRGVEKAERDEAAEKADAEKLKKDENYDRAVYRYLVAKAGDDKMAALADAAGKREQAAADAKADRDAEVAKALEKRWKKKSEAQNGFDLWKRGRDAAYEEWIEDETIKLNTSATNVLFRAKIPPLESLAAVSNALYERNLAMADAVMSKSKTDDFFDRRDIFSPSSTAFAAMFDDFKAMTRVRAAPAGPFRDKVTVDGRLYKEGKYGNTIEFGVAGKDDSKATFAKFSNTMFVAYFGKRWESGKVKTVECLTADATIRREEDAWKTEKVTITYDELKNNSRYNPQWEAYEDRYGLDDNGDIDFPEGFNKEEIPIYVDELKYTNNTLHVVRVKFVRDDSYADGYAEALDEAGDAFQKEVDDAEKARDESLNEAAGAHAKAVADADEAYAEAVEAAAEARDEAYAKANAAFVQGCASAAPEANEKIYEAKARHDKYSAGKTLREFEDDTLAPLMEARDGNMSKADSRYQKSVEDAAEARDKAVEAAAEVLSSARRAAAEAYNAAVADAYSTLGENEIRIREAAAEDEVEIRPNNRMRFVAEVKPADAAQYQAGMSWSTEVTVTFSNFVAHYKYRTDWD